MENTTLKIGQKAIYNYSRIHYVSDKDKARDGMVVEILDIYKNGHCSIQFSEGMICDVITSAMISELTLVKGA